MPSAYDEVPGPVIEACQQILRASAIDKTPTADPALLDSPGALRYAEAAALEAVRILTEQRGSSSDLLFAAVLEQPALAAWSAPMPSLLHYLRARLASQDAVLRLDPGTFQPALTLLLLAGQALASAAGDHVGSVRAAGMLEHCLAALATDPIDAHLPAGDLALGLDFRRADLTEQLVVRDQLRAARTGAVPLVRALPTADRACVLLVPDLTARHDIRDLLRMLSTDRPHGGATVITRCKALAAPPVSLVRLEIEWLEPVHAEVAVVLDLDEHGAALQGIAACSQIGLSPADPQLQTARTELDIIQIPVDGREVRAVLAETARRQRAR